MAKQGYPTSGSRYGAHPGTNGYPATGARFGSHPEGSTQPVPLLSFDARDYDTYLDGDPITGSLTPAIGSAITASGSPTMKVNAIGAYLTSISTP